MAKRGGKQKQEMAAPRRVTSIDAVIGQRIRTRRMELHMSQEELANELGVSFQQVQKYEKGVNRLTAHRLQQVANAFNTALDYFMSGMDNGKVKMPTDISTFMATKDGVSIVEAMMRLNEPHRRGVIALARTLGTAYGQ